MKEIEKIELIKGDFIPNKKSIRALFEELDEKTDGEFKSDYFGPIDLGSNWQLDLEEDYGGEGMGDERWVVMKLANPNNPNGKFTYWKIPGFYQSSYGSSFEIENTFEVEPKEEIVIKWKAKK